MYFTIKCNIQPNNTLESELIQTGEDITKAQWTEQAQVR